MRGPGLSADYCTGGQSIAQKVKVIIHRVRRHGYHTFQKARSGTVNSECCRIWSESVRERKLKGETFFDYCGEERQLVQSGNVGNGSRVRHGQVQFGVEALLDVRTTRNFPKDVSHSDRGGVYASDARAVMSGWAEESKDGTHVCPMPSEMMS